MMRTKSATQKPKAANFLNTLQLSPRLHIRQVKGRLGRFHNKLSNKQELRDSVVSSLFFVREVGVVVGVVEEGVGVEKKNK